MLLCAKRGIPAIKWPPAARAVLGLARHRRCAILKIDVIAHQAEAVVLRTWPIHEADQIVSLLTRDAGKIKGVAKAASKSRRRFGGALEPMTHVRANYVLRPRQELVRLDSFEIIRSPLSDPIDYARVAALSFYAEVLEEMLPENDPQDAIFRLLISVLAETRVGQVWMPVTYFALWITRLMGWMPDLRHCTICRHRFAANESAAPAENGPADADAAPAHAAEPAWWLPQQDGLFCDQHRSLGSLALSPASQRLAQRMLREPASALASESWPRNRFADLRRFSTQALERHLEQRLSSVSALLKLGS